MPIMMDLGTPRQFQTPSQRREQIARFVQIIVHPLLLEGRIVSKTPWRMDPFISVAHHNQILDMKPEGAMEMLQSLARILMIAIKTVKV